jgi:hypothetical protein
MEILDLISRIIVYGREILSLNLLREQNLRVFDKGVQEKYEIYRDRKREREGKFFFFSDFINCEVHISSVEKYWRKLHVQKLYNFCYS